AEHPTSFGHLLGAADMAIHGAVEVAIAGRRHDPRFRLLENEIARHYVPSLVLAGGEGERDGIALMDGRRPSSGRPTAYVCQAYACDEPATEPAMLALQLQAAGRVYA
ncbi:MAG: thioredoxin domain-containing protein, partial [Gemmatimonadaceae bacterium]